jgi:hypothetical protein
MVKLYKIDKYKELSVIIVQVDDFWCSAKSVVAKYSEPQ